MKPVTIIGRGPSWKECPFNTEELWGTVTCLTTPGLAEKNYTKVFAFDNDQNIIEAVAEANRRHIPVVGYPFLGYATEAWPAREIVKEFRSSYFVNSISRMIAYAIYLKSPKLMIFGIDQGPTWALQQAKPVVTFWLGYALARGIDLHLGRGSLWWAYDVGPVPTVEPTLEPENMRIATALEVA